MSLIVINNSNLSQKVCEINYKPCSNFYLNFLFIYYIVLEQWTLVITRRGRVSIGNHPTMRTVDFQMHPYYLIRYYYLIYVLFYSRTIFILIVVRVNWKRESAHIMWRVGVAHRLLVLYYTIKTVYAVGKSFSNAKQRTLFRMSLPKNVSKFNRTRMAK